MLEQNIKCPECAHVQSARIEKTPVWDIFFHDCVECGHTIMESEWDVQPTTTSIPFPFVCCETHKPIALGEEVMAFNWGSEGELIGFGRFEYNQDSFCLEFVARNDDYRNNRPVYISGGDLGKATFQKIKNSKNGFIKI